MMGIPSLSYFRSTCHSDKLGSGQNDDFESCAMHYGIKGRREQSKNKGQHGGRIGMRRREEMTKKEAYADSRLGESKRLTREKRHLSRLCRALMLCTRQAHKGRNW